LAGVKKRPDISKSRDVHGSAGRSFGAPPPSSLTSNDGASDYLITDIHLHSLNTLIYFSSLFGWPVSRDRSVCRLCSEAKIISQVTKNVSFLS
jgi:hypothetical protein